MYYSLHSFPFKSIAFLITTLVLTGMSSPLTFGESLTQEIRGLEIVYNRSKAISICEGYYVPGSRAQRNNNPGNLRAGKPYDDKRFTIYPSPLHGHLALTGLVYKSRHQSIKAMVKWYAGNSPDWVNCVTSKI